MPSYSSWRDRPDIVRTGFCVCLTPNPGSRDGLIGGCSSSLPGSAAIPHALSWVLITTWSNTPMAISDRFTTFFVLNYSTLSAAIWRLRYETPLFVGQHSGLPPEYAYLP